MNKKNRNKFIYFICALFIFSCYDNSISKEKINLYNMNSTPKTFTIWKKDFTESIEKLKGKLRDIEKRGAEISFGYLPTEKLVTS